MFASIEAQLTAELATVQGDPDEVDAIWRTLDSARGGNAEALKDWQRCVDITGDSLSDLVARVCERAAGLGGRLPPQAEEVLGWLSARDDRTWSASIGNKALSRATALYRLGVTAADPDRYQEAHQLLRLAAKAYQGYGSNGFVAIALTRARLMASAPGGSAQPVSESVSQLLDTSRHGIQSRPGPVAAQAGQGRGQ